MFIIQVKVIETNETSLFVDLIDARKSIQITHSSQALPVSFKADCGYVGESAVYHITEEHVYTSPIHL